MALDVLIAVSARRWKAIVVTENWRDFKIEVKTPPLEIRATSNLYGVEIEFPCKKVKTP